ncbi:MAG: GNAT family N-acetyltransferase [Devosia sp.]|nr:GNAT family N-acetyltransferase [Devosia sp.]
MSLTAELDREGHLAWHGAERRAMPRLTVSVHTVPAETWDPIAAGYDGVVQEQLFAYARTRWPSARPEALLFKLGGEVVGGTLVMIQRLPLGVGAIAVCKWGPIFKDASRPDVVALYDAMISAMIGEYAVKRKMMLSVLPRAATADHNWQYERLVARRFRPGATLLFPNRYIVNLRLSDEAQRKSFHQKWRYHLNKAEKAGLSFESAGVERAAEFDALYQAMTDRKNFPDHSAYNTIPALFSLETPTLRPELFFVRHAGEVVAGAIIFKAGDTAVYLFGATNDKALPLRAGYFLHWNIIRWLRDNTSAKWYDLGGTDGFQGLHQFKKGMVGEAGVISQVPPVANYAAYRLPLLLGEGAFEARELLNRLRRRLEGMVGGKAKPNQQQSASASHEGD